jgi:hypothetical protein
MVREGAGGWRESEKRVRVGVYGEEVSGVVDGGEEGDDMERGRERKENKEKGMEE